MSRGSLEDDKGDDDGDGFEFSEDLKVQELQSIELVFPSCTWIDYRTLCGTTKIRVLDEDGFEVVALKNLERDLSGTSPGKEDFGGVGEVGDTVKVFVKNLPPMKFWFKLTSGYPYEEPPEIELHCDYICREKLAEVCTETHKLWESYRDQILYQMIDFLQEKMNDMAKDMVGLVIDCGTNVDLFNEISEFDKNECLSRFNSKTFTCGICQDDHKGCGCVEFDGCTHVFCRKCLFEYFSSLINTGEVDKIHCPDFECTRLQVKEKDRLLNLQNLGLDAFNFTEFKLKIMQPPISLDNMSLILQKNGENRDWEDSVKRYQHLFYKQQYDLVAKIFPSRLVSCPRVGCFESIFRENVADALVRCPKCKYAFCNDCRRSWHGAYKECKKKEKAGIYSDIPIDDLQLWIDSEEGSTERLKLGYKHGKVLMRRMANEYLMDKMFEEMISDRNQGFNKCPTCDTVIERLDGCNKMKCSKCFTFFCNLCGIYLDPSSPYDHYRDYISPCYGKLFQGMPGLED